MYVRELFSSSFLLLCFLSLVISDVSYAGGKTRTHKNSQTHPQGQQVNGASKASPHAPTWGPEWAFNEVGGTYARFLILYCHMNEYLGLWGVTTPQFGYSGSYKEVDFWDFIISGEIASHGLESDHSLTKHFLPPEEGRPDHETLSPFLRGKRKISNYTANTFMIDYARGNILSAFGDGAIYPYLFDSHDGRSLRVQLSSCAKSIMEQIHTSTKRCVGTCT